uniref:MATH domain-containing protein n=1 Tax=Aegilops tauschii TaxID=37682 RepID=M8CBT1_AEGTA
MVRRPISLAGQEEEGAMGNSGSTAPAPLGKTHVPDLEWKVHDFSALLETKATSALSAPFHCSGYNWCLQVTPKHKQDAQVTPKHKQDDKGNPYVALSLMVSQGCLEPGHTVHAEFELSIFNHSKGMYYGYKASYNYAFQNGYSNKECLISLQDLLKSSAFLVDYSCVFGVEILKIDVSSPEKKAVVVQKKATTVQNLFIQKKGFIKGTYTWTINNFQELDSQNFVRSPTFEVGGHKWYSPVTSCIISYIYTMHVLSDIIAYTHYRWPSLCARQDSNFDAAKSCSELMGVPAYTQAQTRLSDFITNHILQIHFPGYPIVFEVSLPILANRYIGMYPRGERHRTDCLALGLYRESADELSRKVMADLLVCTHPEGWGWIAFLPLKELQDMSRGYLIESKCVLKADFTIFGSSNDG